MVGVYLGIIVGSRFVGGGGEVRPGRVRLGVVLLYFWGKDLRRG